MPEYQRINVKQEWYDKIGEYLRENPEEGFDEDQVKEFIKYAVNKRMNDDRNEQFEELKKLMRDISSH